MGIEKAISGKRRPANWVDFELWTLIAAPLFQGVSFELVGKLLGSDMIFLVMFPFVFARRSYLLRERGPLWVLGLMSLWLLSQVVTDLYRQTPFEDYTRGWAKIVLFGVGFCTIYMAVNKELSRLRVLLISSVIGIIMAARLFPRDLVAIEPWKFGYGLGVTLGLFVASSWIKSRWAAIGLPFGAAALNIAFNTRNLFGVAAISGAIAASAGGGARGRSGGLARPIGVFAIVVVAGLSTLFAYSYLASSGVLGRLAQAKYEMQTHGDVAFISGRGEFLASSQAIADSPIVGHGSWARDREYVGIMIARLRALGIQTPLDETDLIPSHSYLFGSWVEAGLLGGLFWAWCFVQAARAVGKVSMLTRMDTALNSYVLLNFIWSLWFSPFAWTERFSASAALCLIMIVNQKTWGKNLVDALGTRDVTAAIVPV